MTAAGEDARARRGLVIAPLTPRHAEQVLAIQQAGLDAGDASFETIAPDWPTWDAAYLPHHRLVATFPGTGPGTDEVVGWVAVARTSDRRVQAGVVEHSVYVAPRAHGRGVGSALLRALIASTEEAGIWTVQTHVLPEGTDTLALHRAHGFRIVGIRERIGQQRGEWRDVLLLERRSPVV